MAGSVFQWNLLEQAANAVEPGAFEGYFELKRLLASNRPSDKQRFEGRFSSYYRLHIGGLTEAFKKRYFEHLHSCRPIGKKDPYTALLMDLYQIQRRQGGHSIQASFVSKLVSIHDESRPIYDRHVSNFFGVGVPALGPPEFRMAGFVWNLALIQSQYEGWAVDKRFRGIRKTLIQRQPQLEGCHSSRLCDLLVWTVGSKGLR
jgi:hypothetical protein